MDELFELPTPEPTIDDIRDSAEVSFSAVVSALGDAPLYRSGYVVAYQEVRAEVTELRRGEGLQPGDQVALAVPVIGASSLDPSLFYEGAPFAAWASWQNDRWTAILVDIETAQPLA
jgi:hypothetical protein